MIRFYGRTLYNIGLIGIGVYCTIIAVHDLLHDLTIDEEVAREKAQAYKNWSKAVGDCGNRETSG